MAIWLTSDWHFGHDREFIWKVRGFSSVEEMNEVIIKNHNDLVYPSEEVYVLGDLCLGDNEKGGECISRMNGKLHVIIGNHDTDRRKQMYAELPNIVEVVPAAIVKYDKYTFFMTHFPCLTGNLEKENLRQMILNLYGHTHQTTNFFEDRPYMYHVGVDSHACTPVFIGNIIEEMQKKVRECETYL